MKNGYVTSAGSAKSPEFWEKMFQTSIRAEDLERIQRSIHPGDQVIWGVIDTGVGQEKGNLRRRLRLTVTGCYRHVVTARASSGRVHSRTWIELAMEQRKGRKGRG